MLFQGQSLAANIIVSQFIKLLKEKYTKENKKATFKIVAALAVCYFLNKKLRPPKKLRHLPYQSIFGFIASFFRGDTYWDKTLRVYLPMVKSINNEGAFMTFERYGWTVHIVNPEDAKQVLMDNNLFPKANVIKGRERTLNGRYLAGQNILMSNGQRWKSHRMIANPAFHRAMPVRLFGKMTENLFEKIEQGGSKVEVTNLMQRLTLDVIGNAGFGFDFKATTETNNEWISLYDDIKRGLQDPFFFIMPLFDQHFLWMLPKRQVVHQKLDRFFNKLEQIIIEKRQLVKTKASSLEENEKDLLTLMIEGEERGEGSLTNAELRSNLAIFFLAGHDTTSSALSFAIYYLAKYPEYQKKARDEVLSILGDSPENIVPTVEQAKSMKFLDQVIKEALRIGSPVTFAVPRVAAEDTVLTTGKFIPKGTLLVVDMMVVHHNSAVWKNPREFKPERFEEGGEASQFKGEKGFQWMPFGNGPRICIGKNFSLVEQYVFLSMLLRKYTWSLPVDSPHKENVQIKGFGVLIPNNLEIKFQKRF